MKQRDVEKVTRFIQTLYDRKLGSSFRASTGMIDGRKLRGQEVKDVLFRAGYIQYVCPHGATDHSSDEGHCHRGTCNGLRVRSVHNKKIDWYSSTQILQMPHPSMLPIEVVWALLKPVIEKHSGFSLSRCEEWHALCIFPVDSKYEGRLSAKQKSDNLRKMEEILLKLQQAGYIVVQFHGNIWNITITGGKDVF